MISDQIAANANFNGFVDCEELHQIENITEIMTGKLLLTPAPGTVINDI